jgi:hypothetical protein
MPKSIARSLRCACGTTFNATSYQTVNVTREPRLQYVVLAGLLNVVTCPNCGRKATLPHPFVYHDMERNLLVYVHPRTTIAAEDRQKILDRLQDIYAMAVDKPEQLDGEDEVEARQVPALQVVFGIDQLIALISRVLPPDELLGKLALNSHSRQPAERQRLLNIAHEMARQMGCLVEAQESEDGYIVWIYGSRRAIGAIMRELAPRQ